LAGGLLVVAEVEPPHSLPARVLHPKRLGVLDDGPGRGEAAVFPAAEHAERVRISPAHYRGDLVGGVDRKRPNVFIMDGKRQRPFLPQLSELLPVLLDTAISLDPICPRHGRSTLGGGDTT
jgi:hypothetical protein